MNKIAEKSKIVLDALKTLSKSIDLFYEYQHRLARESTQENTDLFLSMRDSMIKRFKYCTDLFWKILKSHLEEAEKITIAVPSPRGTIREAIKVRVISEEEGSECINMIESRNKTSHTYHEIMAEEIAYLIPDYYELMQSIVNRLFL